MGSGREFEHKTVPIDGKPVTCSLLECGEAGCSERILFKHNGVKKPPEAMEQYFRNHGWRVGGNRRGDRCPQHSHGKPTRKEVMEQVAQALENAATPPVEVVKADAPRTMTRDDRRMVFAKIDEVYLDEERGYQPPWTDGAVAKDLGVPRAWVTEIRDENFGPEGSNVEYGEYQEKVREIEERLTLLGNAVDGFVRGTSERMTALTNDMAALKLLSKRIDKEVGKGAP